MCLRPQWVEGKQNVLADALSRQNWPVVSEAMQSYVKKQGYSASAWLASLQQLGLNGM